MATLIDAEELETEILSLWDTEKFDNIKDVTVKLTDVMWKVYHAPSVDAIPVEWIKKRIKEYHILTALQGFPLSAEWDDQGWAKAWKCLIERWQEGW